MRFRSILLPGILFFPLIAFCQDPEFYREDIRFEIRDSRFYVNGDYFFCNTGQDSVNKVLFYPFPRDDAYGVVDEIRVVDLSEGEPVAFRREQSGIFFPLKLTAFSSKKYHISYRQAFSGPKVEYILQTTRQWGKPLELANYQLLVPDDLKIDSLSLKPDSCLVVQQGQKFTWHKVDFNPKENFVIYFHPAHQ